MLKKAKSHLLIKNGKKRRHFMPELFSRNEFGAKIGDRRIDVKSNQQNFREFSDLSKNEFSLESFFDYFLF